MLFPDFRHQRGQGMTEYIIIVALIAVAALGSFKYFGQTARSQAAAAAREVAGQEGQTMHQAAVAASNEARDQALDDKSMADFSDND